MSTTPPLAAARLQTVRDCYAAFAADDRALIERCLAPGFVFSAPPDVGLDRDGFFARCWPGAGSTVAFAYDRLFAHEDEVHVTYVATRPDGTRFRNTEIFGFAEGETQVSRQEVYFGWDLE